MNPVVRFLGAGFESQEDRRVCAVDTGRFCQDLLAVQRGASQPSAIRDVERHLPLVVECQICSEACLADDRGGQNAGFLGRHSSQSKEQILEPVVLLNRFRASSWVSDRIRIPFTTLCTV